MIEEDKISIAIIGLGYVGLPLAVEFSKKYPVLGFDLNLKRIKELNTGYDRTKEINSKELKSSQNLLLSAKNSSLKYANIYIVTVPTPVDKNNTPNLKPLESASETIGLNLKKGNIVIYESTVYPGATEEICVPILEKVSGLRYNKDFFCGYSPERINPGDKQHTLTTIKKITSGSNPVTADFVKTLYESIIKAGVFPASSIAVAEAAKVIENTQRDVNIALINELALIFNKLNINTNEVLEAAGTKWNFLPFKPGLVGGHCIGVDPYYLAQKAQEYGYNPEIILAGRRMNDSMGDYVASKVIKTMIKKDIKIKGSEILILGITFKENCPDVRNTKVVDVIAALKQYEVNVTIYDPWADEDEVLHEYNLVSVKELPKDKFDTIVLTVAHNEFKNIDLSIFKKENAIIYDVKGILGKKADAKL